LVAVEWNESFRIIFARYPFVGIYDRIAEPNDIEAVIELERLTNVRVRDEAGDISLVSPKDRISGPGSTPIMAAFTHARQSRFSDGSYGIYYAARVLETAIAETVFHVELLYRSTSEQSADIDMRAYSARIDGVFDDLRSVVRTDSRLDPHSYAASQPYARALQEADDTDGIVYPSVRDPHRRDCVGCFRPRSIRSCHLHGYLTYRWDGLSQRVTAIFHRESLEGP
jgi:RES domain